MNRHCEALNELTRDELTTLGPLMQQYEHALARVLGPARVHFSLYGESVSHVHWHVLPQIPELPAGNIPLTLLEVRYRLLQRLGLRHAFPDSTVAEVAARLRAAWLAAPPLSQDYPPNG